MVSLEKMTLAELCLKAVEKFKNRRAFEIYRDGKVYDPVNYRMLGLRARQFGALLESLGVKAGDRVMILAENCPEWAEAYFGIALIGAVSAPVLTDFTPEQIGTIAAHADISAVCVTERTAQKTGGIGAEIPRIYLDTLKTSILVSIRGIAKQLPLRDPGKPAEESLPKEDDLAAIVYTSGATGMSKGVMLSHRSIVFCVQASRSMMKIFSRDRFLSVIPLAHTYECTVGLLTALINGAATSYLDKPPSPVVLLPAIQALRPTIMVTVPLFIEKIYRHRIAPDMYAGLFYRFAPTRPLARYLAGRRLTAAFGGSVRFFGIGGAPIAPDVEDFLRQVKFPFAPGYGLTETAPLLAVTRPYHFAPRSAGSALKGVDIRIGPDGEIQARGPNVMQGYYRDEAGTRAVFTEDGWFKTGDLGYLDRKGRLFIRGRIKAVILGPSGENIYPEEIESLLKGSALTEEALVRSGARGELEALIVLSEAAEKRRAGQPEAFNRELETLKNEVNRRLPSFSRISDLAVQDRAFEKTPTQKIKRYLYQH
jgi:long-chain acyl-CoA synthetase